jgi:hypothetical protein
MSKHWWTRSLHWHFLTPWHIHLAGVYCYSLWLPFVLKTELTQVNLALVTMELKGSRTSLNATSAQASALQWTYARCQIWQLHCPSRSTGSRTHQTMNSELELTELHLRVVIRLLLWYDCLRVFFSVFNLVVLHLSLHAVWLLPWYNVLISGSHTPLFLQALSLHNNNLN